MCRICKSFLVTEAKRKHVRRRARFQYHRDASCHQVFFTARQGAEGTPCEYVGPLIKIHKVKKNGYKI